MTLQLPQHLQGRQSHNIAEKAAAGIGSSLPPHVSIQGNTFTLIDAGGQEASVGASMDVVVVDVSEQVAKRFYPPDKPWTKDSKDPPTCWSTNGVVPDASATVKQARACAECQWNERGSAVSKMSGVAIKACRDEKWLAIMLPAYPQMLFQLVVTPGSFKNWQAYTKNFGNGVDMSDVITRLDFQQGDNGVMTFEILGYAQNQPQFISNDIAKVLDSAWAEKKTDILVGRNDQPIALAAPTVETAYNGGLPVQVQPQQGAVPFSPAPFAAMTTPQTTVAGSVGQGQPVEQPQRRRRRTAAEMAAAQGQPQQQAAPANPAPMQAPFASQAQPATFQPAPAPGGNGATFGMQEGVTPNPELAKTLEGLFGKK